MGANKSFSNSFLSQARREREELIDRLKRLSEDLEILNQESKRIQESLRATESTLAELDHLLGIAPQLRITSQLREVRGLELRNIAVAILGDRSNGEPVHYRDWHVWLNEAGFAVSGKDPLANFLAQVSQDPRVRSLGGKSGLYALIDIDAEERRSAKNASEEPEISIVARETSKA